MFGLFQSFWQKKWWLILLLKGQVKANVKLNSDTPQKSNNLYFYFRLYLIIKIDNVGTLNTI